MKVDISLDNVKVYNIEDRVDIVKGEKFSLFTDATQPIHFFSNNDFVLDLKDTGKDLEGEAKEIGTSTILMMDSDFQRLKTININVVASVEMVSNLGITFGQPEPK
jgi:hypothetical protein